MKGLFLNLRLLLPIAPLVVVVPWLLSQAPQTSPTPASAAPSAPSPLIAQISWDHFLQNQPHFEPHRESLLKLSSRISLEKFKTLSPALQERLASFATSRLDPTIPAMTLCWAPGVSIEVMEAFHAVEEMAADEPGEFAAATQFEEGDRWGRTATFNSFFETTTQGQPTTLRWSFMTDGTSIFGFNGEPTSGSDLISFLDARYSVTNGGSDLTTRPWFTSFQAAFDNIASVTGITYVYEPNDDGAALSQSSSPSGQIGVRGDLRIGGHFIDGESGPNTLAYNFFPSSGDMVIDTSNTSFYGDTSSDALNLRNVVEHEHGHGLGLSHVCPITQTKLMEPNISRRFRGLQLDGIFALNRLYGDFFEKHNSSRNNDSVANAAPLPITLGTSYQRDHLSIDDNNDSDFFLIQNLPLNTFITCRVTPTSTPSGFSESAQNPDGSCAASATFDFTNIHDLNLALISPDGSTILTSATSQPLGQAEEIIAFQLPSSGDYYLRVTGDSSNTTQLYQLEVELGGIPLSPSNLLATTATAGQVELSWTDNSSDETGFQIERKLERNGPWSPYDTTPSDSESYQDLTPIPGTNLFYRVSALGLSANSAPSGEANAMVVDLSAQSYLYDLGGTQGPLAPGAFRVSRQTTGDVSWSGSVSSRDRGGSDPFDRDYLSSSNPRTWSHRITNGVWQIIVRQGDETNPREDLTISVEGTLRAENIDTAANEFAENTFLVEITDNSLDLTFDDLGGASDRWIVNRIDLTRLSPYRSWAFLENLPENLANPDQDADGDGILNLQEYYFNLPPLSQTDSPLVTSALSPDNSSYLFKFTRDPTAEIDALIFEVSQDLTNWLPFTPTPATLSTTENGALEDVIITLPTTSSNQGFIRLGLNISE